MDEAILRFIIGGVFVTAFSVLGDILKPKSFAGLFGAASSIALAASVLTIHHEGVSYAALEARSMIAGAVAFFIYAYCVSFVLMRFALRASLAAGLLIIVWFGIAIGLKTFCMG
jgi:hypothetical protein